MKKHHLHHAIFLATIITGTLSLTACDKMAEKASEKILEEAIESESGKKVDIDMSGDNFSIKSDEGSISSNDEGGVARDAEGNIIARYGDNIKVPDDYPKDVPIPKNLVIEHNSKFSGNNELMGYIEGGDRNSIQAELESMVQKEGWKKNQYIKSSKGIAMIFDKDGRQMSYSLTDNDQGMVDVIISVGKKAY